MRAGFAVERICRPRTRIEQPHSVADAEARVVPKAARATRHEAGSQLSLPCACTGPIFAAAENLHHIVARIWSRSVDCSDLWWSSFWRRDVSYPFAVMGNTEEGTELVTVS